MLRTRIISAVVGIPILLAVAWAGSYYWMTLICLLALISLYEILRGAKSAGIKPLWVIGYLVLCLGLGMPFFSPTMITSVLVSLLFFSVILMVFLFPRYHIIDLAVSWFYPAYIGVFMSYAIRLADVHNHFAVIVFGFILTWASDTGGYFAGSWWGNHKLAPKLSPKKTWEGFFGGFVLTVIVAIAGSLIIPGYALYKFIILGIAVGALAPIGDLFASAIKRDMDIKDYGKIIPGHGGILDRFDSFMIIVPLMYFFSLWLGG